MCSICDMAGGEGAGLRLSAGEPPGGAHLRETGRVHGGQGWAPGRPAAGPCSAPPRSAPAPSSPAPRPGYPSLAPAMTHQTRSGRRPTSSGTPAELSALPRSPSWVPSQVCVWVPLCHPRAERRAPEVRRHPFLAGPGGEAWRPKTGHTEGQDRPASHSAGGARASVCLHNSSPRKVSSKGRGQNPEEEQPDLRNVGLDSTHP